MSDRDADVSVELWELIYSAQLPKLCGVYVLINDGAVVYVGKSVNILGRILTEHNRKFVFDEVRWRPCSRAMLNTVEAEAIRVLRPLHNKRPGNRWADADRLYDTGVFANRQVGEVLKRLAMEILVGTEGP